MAISIDAACPSALIHGALPFSVLTCAVRDIKRESNTMDIKKEKKIYIYL